jgi:hypothetical protein
LQVWQRGDGRDGESGREHDGLLDVQELEAAVLGRAGPDSVPFRVFNLFNTPNFGQPNGISFTTTSSVTPDGPRDAEIRSLRNPMRVIQFAAKIYF